MSDHENKSIHITTAKCKGRHGLCDMAQANSDAALVKKPVNISSGREYEKCSYAFFPGCQLGAAEPEIVIKAYDSILFQHPDTAIFLRCCGAPAKFAENENAFEESLRSIQTEWEAIGRPTLIAACTSCMEILKTELPQINMISIYEFIRNSGISGGCNSEDYRLLSSHADTGSDAADDIIKELAEEMGVKLHPGHEGEYPYITDCIDCRDSLKNSGSDAVHILELIYGMGESNAHMIHEHDHGDNDGHDITDKGTAMDVNNAQETTECDGNCADCTSLCWEHSYTASAKLPSHDERLANRTELKKTLLALFWNEM